jgi:hypothetical protein
MHDNDGVGASFYFTSIPCGNNIPRLFIGHSVTVAYIYKAIKSCQQNPILRTETIEQISSMPFFHASSVTFALTAAVPWSYVQHCRSRPTKRVLYIHLIS